ncbi:MAG: FAD:protein FMN transferase [Gammaproteobacteria bacterium]
MKKFFVVFLVAILLGGCTPKPQEYRDTLFVFGTVVNITLWGVEKTKAEQAIKDIEKDLKYLHVVWHPWRFGAMSRTNELLAYQEWFSANPSVLPVINKSKKLYKLSDGLFNPAIGQLIGMWSFHHDEILDGPAPDEKKIEAFINDLPTMDHVEVDNFRIRSTHPKVKLDMGAIAKGMAVERVIDYLRQAGIKNAIVNAGGDLKAIGNHGDRAWSVGIRHPRKDGILAGLEVHDNESVFTSGDYERNFVDEKGKIRHHILDPRTGYPAKGTQSVTVIHSDAGLADAAATALFIAGPSQWLKIAKQMGIQQAMLIDEHGKVLMTPAMAKRIQFEIEPEQKEIVALP